MRVGIIQSSYIPWRGYFDFIDDTDLFIFHDDIQYTKHDWRNRNKIKTSHGATWLTVAVNYRHTSQRICDTTIDYSQHWVDSHVNQIKNWYTRAPFFKLYSDELFVLLGTRYGTISDLNITLCRWIMKKLEIQTRTTVSSELGASGTKTQRLIDILRRAGGDCYLSGPTARSYLDETLFRENRMHLEYKSYDYQPYPQLWGDYIGEVTVLDLLFNVGPDARRYLKSRTPNVRVL